jgi:uncharacterized protein (DUF305 family)
MRTVRTALRCTLIGMTAAAGVAAAQIPPSDFASACRIAMDRMMAGMDIAPTGEVDRDFVAMMTPHHQGAIDMAVAELRYGHDEKLKRIAQEIIVDQQQEIAAMKLAIGEPLPASTPAPTQSGAPTTHMHMQMHKEN